jgi:hypothetical protein
LNAKQALGITTWKMPFLDTPNERGRYRSLTPNVGCNTIEEEGIVEFLLLKISKHKSSGRDFKLGVPSLKIFMLIKKQQA